MTAPLVAFAASVVATIVLIAFIPILYSNVEYMPADSWQMRAVAINGANFVPLFRLPEMTLRTRNGSNDGLEAFG